MERLVSRRPRFFSGLLGMILLVGLAFPASAMWIDLGGDDFAVRMLESDGQRTVYEITVGGFDAEPVLIGGETYFSIGLAGESVDLAAGYPSLPDVRRAVIIPDDRKVAVSLLEVESVDLPFMPVMPSKGNLLRSVDPATVPYEFGEVYRGDEAWPVSPVDLEAPHILRDYRGVIVDANVFQYLPARETLRVHKRMVLEVKPVGAGDINVLDRAAAPEKLDPQFAELYSSHFLNFGAGDRYTPVLEDGSLLIVAYDAFYANMLPLVEWKMQKGIDTKLVSTSETGTTATQIKAYIQNEYDTGDLGYVLLVGDGPQIPIPSGGSDPMYSLLAGGDSYPDIFVGRFSAENATQVATQVERTIHYERDVTASESWMQYGMGVASNEGPGDDGEYDDEHSDVIRGKLLAYGYLGVDQIYQPTGTAAQVSAGLNAGRGIVNYTGHGSTTSWSTTGFSNTHVNALVNDNMLPFICSVACNNGTFTSTTCYAEAWQRATNNGVPTGAIASYMSYISQSWNPPMCGQDEAIDLLVEDQMRTIGGLWFNGSCQMMDEYGSSGINEFENWTIFGDPSIAVRTKQPEVMALNHSGALFIGMSEYEVTIPGLEGALCALYADGVLYGAALTNAGGMATISMVEPPDAPMSLTLTVTAYNKVTAQEAVEVLPPSGPYLVFENCIVLDGGGDADGELDEGESVGMTVTLENVGVDATTNVYAYLSCDDPYVTITAGGQSYPDIPAGGFGSNIDPFELEIAGTIPDGHLVQFAVEAHSDDGIWDANFALTAQAPILGGGALTVVDLPYGDGSGTADAGETINLRMMVGNTGSSDCAPASGTLTSGNINVIIHDGLGECAEIPMGGEALMAEFVVEILPGCPEPSSIAFELLVEGPSGFSEVLAYELPVGGWFDDMEVDRGWTVGYTGDDAGSGIWTRVDPIGTEYGGGPCAPEDDHTPAPGVNAFVTGQGSLGGTAGENDVDGGKTTLLSPVFHLDGADSAEFSYWRWYTNDLGNNPGEDYWDVDVTSDGVNWVSLEHTSASANLWTQMSFQLTDYITLTDNVQVRFVASDEINGSLVEAGVDDVFLRASWSIQTDTEDAVPARLALGANFPNPFNPKTTLSFALPEKGEVDLAVFDVRGRRVATIAAGVMEPGRYELIWDGTDEAGKSVASGVYFSRLAYEGQSLTQKMIMLK